MIDDIFKLTKEIVNSSGKITEEALKIARDISHGSLKLTEDGLHSLSSIFFFIDHWQKGLKEASHNVRFSAEVTKNALEDSITVTDDAFKFAINSVGQARDVVNAFVFENKAISSIIGSAHNNAIGISKINMSFRSGGKDISPEEAYAEFEASGMKKAILFIPGLFCDESLWTDQMRKTPEGEVFSPGLADMLKKEGYFPFYVRYNQGKHISENGRDLLKILEKLLDLYKGALDIFTYSQGGLLIRSTLYYSMIEKRLDRNKIGKVLFVSSPDGGSYIEKIGFWVGFLMEQSPELITKVIGFIGNLRSDGIKDLSHGVIREEDWKEWHPLRYRKELYFGELDDIDCYIFYSLIADETNAFQMWFGDGIVEKDSLTYLVDKVYDKRTDKSDRVMEIKESNHFLILERTEFWDRVRKIFIG